MVDNTGGCMNYIYERMMAEGETAIFDKDDLRKFEVM